MFDVKRKTALITGGAKRLGKEIGLELARAGANIIVHHFNSVDAAEELAGEIRKIGVHGWTLPSDLTNREDASNFVAEAIERFGPVDVLVNNASIFNEDGLDDFDGESLDSNIQINAFAPLLLTRGIAKQDRESVVINCLDSRILAYDKTHAAYHLSKRMLHTITKMSAIEFAPRTRVNGVAPGLVLPPPGEDEAYLQKLSVGLPVKKHGGSEHVANAVRFLIQNDFITGQVVYVDGGRHLKTAVYS